MFDFAVIHIFYKQFGWNFSQKCVPKPKVDTLSDMSRPGQGGDYYWLVHNKCSQPQNGYL